MTTPSAKTFSGASRTDTGVDAVTGAFSYSGRAIARRLLDDGRTVRTLTGHPQKADPSQSIEVRPLDFSDPPTLLRSLEGVTTLYNTYWVRFAHDTTNHAQAVENSRTLFHAAAQAGVQRIVHVSITNPAIESPYAYFRGKALVEPAPRDPLRQRRCAHQQHRVAPPPAARVRSGGSREVPHPTRARR
jgi:nucleoside-diphosphate-sugar epimerase